MVLVTRNCFLCNMSDFVSIKIQSFFVVKFLKNIYFFSVMQSQKFIEKIFLFYNSVAYVFSMINLTSEIV